MIYDVPYTKGKICKKARSRGLNEIPILLHETFVSILLTGESTNFRENGSLRYWARQCHQVRQGQGLQPQVKLLVLVFFGEREYVSTHFEAVQQWISEKCEFEPRELR